MSLRPHSSAVVVLVFGCLGLSVSGPAMAQAAPDAAALLRRGTELYKAGVYDKAAQALEEAWRLAPSPTTALNLAQAYEGAGRPAEALRWYDRVWTDEPVGPRHDAAGAGREHLRAHGYLAVTCGPPGAQLSVGAKSGHCPTWGAYLPAGRHALSLTAPDRAPHYGDAELVAGERRELTLDLARVVAAPPSMATAPATDAPGPSSAAPSSSPAGEETGVAATSPAEPAVPAWIGYTLLGVGGAAMILGGVFYGQAADAADSAPTGPSVAEVERRRSLQSEFESDRTLAYGGLGAGAALLLGGGALLVFGGAF